MNVIKSNKDFKEVELSLSLFHSFDFFELVKELSSRTVWILQTNYIKSQGRSDFLIQKQTKVGWLKKNRIPLR